MPNINLNWSNAFKVNNKFFDYKIYFVMEICTQLKTSCSSTTKECENIQINPNGESELALVIRALYINTLDIKNELFTHTDTTISNLNSIKLEEFKINYNSLHTSKPTDLNLRIDGKYERFADTYINSSKRFINNNSKENYNSIPILPNTSIMIQQDTMVIRMDSPKLA